MNTKNVSTLIIAALAFAVGSSAWAHHSYAPYDMTKKLTSNATIKEFYWGAPHSSASFYLPEDKDGKKQALTLQGASPSTLTKAGFNPKDMRRGVAVIVTWHPLRNGKPGGTLASIKFPDGRTFTDNEFGDTSPTTASPTTAVKR